MATKLGAPLVGLLLLTLGAAPRAGEAPARIGWRWPLGEPRSWWMEACVELPEPVTLRAEDGRSVAIDRYQIQLVTSCLAATEAPTGWVLGCSWTASNLVAEALPGEASALPAVLREIDSRLDPAWAELSVSRDGRLDGFTLHDLGGRDRKTRGTAELLGVLFERAYIGLDLSFPPGPELSWGERSPALLTYLPRARSLGAARLLHDGALSEDGRTLELRSRGRGVVAADSLSVGGGEGPLGALSFTLAAQSTARFDVAEGTLAERRWLVLSRVTPSEAVDLSAARHPYAMAGALRLLQPGDAVSLIPTGPWGASPPGESCVALDQARAGADAALEAPLAPRE